MLNWESEITKTWQFTVPVPLPSLSISSWTPSVVFTRRVPLPCISWLAMERRSIKSPNLFLVYNFSRVMCCGLYFSFMKKRPTSDQMSWPSMPLLYSMFGEPLTVTLIFFRAGNMYFPESLVPAVYGSTNSKRMPFMDLLWESTFMFILVSVPLLIGTTFGRLT